MPTLDRGERDGRKALRWTSLASGTEKAPKGQLPLGRRWDLYLWQDRAVTGMLSREQILVVEEVQRAQSTPPPSETSMPVDIKKRLLGKSP